MILQPGWFVWTAYRLATSALSSGWLLPLMSLISFAIRLDIARASGSCRSCEWPSRLLFYRTWEAAGDLQWGYSPHHPSLYREDKH